MGLEGRGVLAETEGDGGGFEGEGDDGACLMGGISEGIRVEEGGMGNIR
jgi:hypothetical protein